MRQDEKEWKEAGKEGERSEESSGSKERVEDHSSESEETVRTFCSPKQCFRRLRGKRAAMSLRSARFQLKLS